MKINGWLAFAGVIVITAAAKISGSTDAFDVLARHPDWPVSDIIGSNAVATIVLHGLFLVILGILWLITRLYQHGTSS